MFDADYTIKDVIKDSTGGQLDLNLQMDHYFIN